MIWDTIPSIQSKEVSWLSNGLGLVPLSSYTSSNHQFHECISAIHPPFCIFILQVASTLVKRLLLRLIRYYMVLGRGRRALLGHQRQDVSVDAVYVMHDLSSFLATMIGNVQNGR